MRIMETFDLEHAKPAIKPTISMTLCQEDNNMLRKFPDSEAFGCFLYLITKPNQISPFQ